MLDIDKLTTENDESPSLESILAEYADYPDAAPGSKRLMQKLQDFEEDNRLKLEQYL